MTFRLRLIIAVLVAATLIQYVPPGPAQAVNPPVLRRLRLPVLMYHYISVPPPGADRYRLDLSVTPENFRQQMQWLKANGYTSISPDELVYALTYGMKLPAHPILITFDDGYEDAYTNAFPILRETGMKGTFFLITDWVDEGRGGYVSWEQAREMARAGMSIESHSRRHLDMRKRSADWLRDEVVGSLEDIETHIGVRPQIFCYPSGDYDAATIRALRDAGIAMAFTTHDGTFMTSDSALWLPRVRVRGATTLENFATLVTWRR